MRSIKLKDFWYEIPNDGIGYDDLHLSLAVIAHEETVEDMEKILSPVPNPIEIYNEDHSEVILMFTEYSRVRVISKEYDSHIDGTDRIADIIRISLEKPTLEEKVAQNTEDIEIINGAIEELAEIIGG